MVSLLRVNFKNIDSQVKVYVSHPEKSIRVIARRRLLALADAELLIQANSHFETLTVKQQIKVLRLLGRKGGIAIHEFLMSMIVKSYKDKALYEHRLAAIESLSYLSSVGSTKFLKKALKDSESLHLDEATVYTLVEAISHSENPDATHAFESAKFIPKRFKLRTSYEQFTKKLSSKMDALKTQMREKNLKVAKIDRSNIDREQELKVVTLNLGLLHNAFAKVPFYYERSALLSDVIKTYLNSKKSPDILFLQELWYIKDFLVVQRAAHEAGFVTAVKRYGDIKNNGLQILVRKSSLTPVENSCEFIPFRDEVGKQVRALFEKAGQVQRGCLSMIVKTKNNISLQLCTTHFTPLPRFFGVRNRQVNCLIKLLKKFRTKSHFVVVGADLNIASDYEGKDDTPEVFWDLDRFNYLLLFKKTKSIDSYATSGNKDCCYTINQNMVGDRYTNKNVQQRLDYIFTCSNRKRSRAEHLKTSLEFTQAIDDKKLYISDHFAVASIIRLIRLKNFGLNV